MRLAYKYRAHPSQEQADRVCEHFDIHANIFNRALDTLDESDDWISEYDMHTRLTDWKTEDNQFDQTNARAAQETIGRIYDAIDGLSEQTGQVGKIRHKTHLSSIEYLQSGFDVRDDCVRLHPFGEIDIVKHREPVGEVKGVTIKQDKLDQWWISVITEVDGSDPVPVEDLESDDVVGIDMNVSNLLTDSDGRQFESLWSYLSGKIDRVQKEQQKLSRKEEGSNNWRKQRRNLQQAYRDLTNARDDILHKLSRWYVDAYDLIAVEDLDSEELSHGIVPYVKEQAWSTFIDYLEYKASHAGVRLVDTDAAYTSQDCSNCGTRVEKELADRTHDCPDCGLETDRDLNAARNVRQRAISSTVGRGPSEFTPSERCSTDEITSISLRTLVDQGSPRL